MPRQVLARRSFVDSNVLQATIAQNVRGRNRHPVPLDGPPQRSSSWDSWNMSKGLARQCPRMGIGVLNKGNVRYKDVSEAQNSHSL